MQKQCSHRQVKTALVGTETKRKPFKRPHFDEVGALVVDELGDAREVRGQHGLGQRHGLGVGTAAALALCIVMTGAEAGIRSQSVSSSIAARSATSNDSRNDASQTSSTAATTRPQSNFNPIEYRMTHVRGQDKGVSGHVEATQLRFGQIPARHSPARHLIGHRSDSDLKVNKLGTHQNGGSTASSGSALNTSSRYSCSTPITNKIRYQSR